MRRWLGLAVVGLLLSTATLPGVASAAPPSLLNSNGNSNPFSPGIPTPTASTPTTTPTPTIASTTTAANDPGLSGSSAIAIAIGALIVLGGISFFIWRDARRRAPVRRAATAGAGIDGRSRTGSKAPPKPRKPSPAERRRRKRGRAR